VAKLVLFVLPLGLDTFAVSTVLGVAGLPKHQRLKISLLLSGFETVMPVIGLLVGHALGHAIGSAADYVAAATLIALGLWMLVNEEEDEAGKVSALVSNSGLALFALGVSISLDELAMGFTIGLLHLSIVWAVILIGAQAFLVAQLGLRLGARLGEAAGEVAEKVAGFAMIGLGVFVLVEKLA
jgi:manganese efflux pump family protein